MSTKIELKLDGIFDTGIPPTGNSTLSISIDAYTGNNIQTYINTIQKQVNDKLASENAPFGNTQGRFFKYNVYVDIVFENVDNKIKCTLAWKRSTTIVNFFTYLKLTLPSQLGFVSPDNIIEIKVTSDFNNSTRVPVSLTASKTLTKDNNDNGGGGGNDNGGGNDKKDDDKKKTPIWVWVVLALVIFGFIGFLVIAGVFGVIYLNKQKNENE